jgi:hypothetical protein
VRHGCGNASPWNINKMPEAKPTIAMIAIFIDLPMTGDFNCT